MKKTKGTAGAKGTNMRKVTEGMKETNGTKGAWGTKGSKGQRGERTKGAKGMRATREHIGAMVFSRFVPVKIPRQKILQIFEHCKKYYKYMRKYLWKYMRCQKDRKFVGGKYAVQKIPLVFPQKFAHR